MASQFRGKHSQQTKTVSLSPRLQHKFSDAISLHRQGKLSLAEAIYCEILKSYPTHFDCLHLLGVVYHQTGRFEDAELKFSTAVRINPHYPAAYNNYGNLLRDMREYHRSLQCLNHAISLNSNFADAHNNKGLTLYHMGNFEEAISSYNEALLLDPNSFNTRNNLANVLAHLGNFNEAIEQYKQAISLNPQYAEAHNNLGLALRATGRIQEALESCERAIQLKPDYYDAHDNIGVVQSEMNRFIEAKNSHEKAISLSPGSHKAYNNLGNTLAELKHFDDALVNFNRAIEIQPDYAEAYCNRGSVLRKMGKSQEAIDNLYRAVQLKPDYVQALDNLGVALTDDGRYDDALRYYEKAIKIDPSNAEALTNRAHLLLRQCNYEVGFKEYTSRLRKKGAFNFRPKSSLRNWDGNADVSRLLLWAEQGIGDEIFWSSMFSLLPRGAKITITSDRRLFPIFQRSFPDLSLLDRNLYTDMTLSEYDAHAAIGDLGHLLNVTEDKIHQRVYPFLQADQSRSQTIRAENRIDWKKTIGIAWRSINPSYGSEKSGTLLDYGPIFAGSDKSFVNLQYGNVEEEISRLKSEIGVSIEQIPKIDIFNDIDGLLSLIDCCSMIVTTSNVTAHLAGAIGKPTALLVPKGKGRLWYWHDAPTSIWYPSIRLFTYGRNEGLEAAVNDVAHWMKDKI